MSKHRRLIGPAVAVLIAAAWLYVAVHADWIVNERIAAEGR